MCFRNILHYECDWDALIDAAGEEPADLISRLLIETPEKRLGHSGAEEVSRSTEFNEISKHKKDLIPYESFH